MIALLAGIAMATPLARAVVEPVPTVITNVAVLDRDGNVGPRRDVVLRDGIIDAVLPVGDGWDHDVTVVIDGSGATLMPGLIDLHVHAASTTAVPGRLRVPSPRDNLEAMLFAGVTTVLDLSMERDHTTRIQDRIAAGRWSGPDYWSSGKPFGAPGGHPASSVRAVFPSFLVKWTTANIAWEVETADDVDSALSRRGRTGFAKIMFDAIPDGVPTLSEEAAQRLRLGATALDERLVAHVGRPEDVDRAIALPVDALMHAPSHGALTEAQAEALAYGHIPVVPTLAVWDAVSGISRGALPDWPLGAEVLSPRQQRDFARVSAGQAPLPDAMSAYGSEVADAAQQRLDNVRRLLDAGVTVLVGSDSPNLGLPPGSGTHYEIDRLVDAGMSRSEALSAATWGNSRFLDPDARFGAVRVGWEADLLLVDGDPVRDPAALQRIVGVWTNGRAVSRDVREQ